MAGTIQPDQVIDQYKIENLTGQDQLRDYYSAFEVDTGQPVALVLLKQEYAGDDLFVQDYLHRIQSLTQIRHPNLTKYLETGVINGAQPFVSMEPVGGFTLDERLERLSQGQASTHTIYALTLVQQMASGLALLERLDLYHHELTPDHIQLRSVTLQGEESVVVTDLDVPHQYPGELYEYSDYTTCYLSPEQLAGKEIDGRSQVYSLGVILHELLCGQRPAMPLTRRNKLWSAIRGGSTLEQLRPNLSGETYALVEQSLSKSRRRRFASVAAFQKALDSALAIEDIPAHVQSGEPAGRPRPVFLIPLLMFFLCGLLGILSFWLVPGFRDSANSSAVIAAQNPTSEPAVAVAASPTTEPTPSRASTLMPSATPIEDRIQQPILDSAETVEAPPAANLDTETPNPSSTATAVPSTTATATSLPSTTPAPTRAPEPSFRVLTSSANLRFGPGTIFGPVGFVYENDELEIIGRNEGDYIWLNVQTTNGLRGWVAANVGELIWPLNLTEIEIAATLPPPPTSTYTPTPTETPLPPTPHPPSSGSGGVDDGGSSSGGGGDDKPRATPTPPL